MSRIAIMLQPTCALKADPRCAGPSFQAISRKTVRDSLATGKCSKPSRRRKASEDSTKVRRKIPLLPVAPYCSFIDPARVPDVTAFT